MKAENKPWTHVQIWQKEANAEAEDEEEGDEGGEEGPLARQKKKNEMK